MTWLRDNSAVIILLATCIACGAAGGLTALGGLILLIGGW